MQVATGNTLPRLYQVMPVPEVTGNRNEELSLPLGGEPGNQTRKEECVQLSLFDYLSGESPSIALCAIEAEDVNTLEPSLNAYRGKNASGVQ